MTSASAIPVPATRFRLPEGREAALPPERRGVARDEVRLLAATPNRISQHRFFDLPDLLEPGDLVVVNTSATIPAALTVRGEAGAAALVHVSTWLDEASWVAEFRAPGNQGPDMSRTPGDRFTGNGLVLTVQAAYPDPTATRSRLWRVSVSPPTRALEHLAAHGRPVTYGHAAADLPLSDRQTVYAREPGSAEMVSAGRPFTRRVLSRLRARGVTVAALTLHAGVSSPEFHEPPSPERYAVPAATARLVAVTGNAGGRVVAVGTTVVRALESAAADGTIRGGSGWTDLVISPARPVRVVTGLVTGLHLPESSHLLLLEAVAGPRLVGAAYEAALAGVYLWHEFGDSMVLLP